MKLAIAALLLAGATPAFAAVDNFVSTSNTAACSTAGGMKGFFEVQSFGFSGADSSSAIGTGSGSGKISLDTFQLLKRFDNCSGVLLTEFLGEKHIQTIVLESKVNGANHPMLTITLTNALISSYSLKNDNETALIESLALKFEKACIVSTPTEPTGQPGKSTTVCYDARTNIVSR